MIHQLNLGSEQHTPGLILCSFEAIVSICTFSPSRRHVLRLSVLHNLIICRQTLFFSVF